MDDTKAKIMRSSKNDLKSTNFFMERIVNCGYRLTSIYELGWVNTILREHL